MTVETLRPMYRTAAAFLCGALLIAGCGSGDDSPQRPRSTSSTVAAPGHEKEGELYEEMMDRTLKLTVTGAESAAVERRLQMRFVTRKGKGENLPFSVASATFPGGITLDDGRHVDAEVGITGLYTGDGKYKLPAGIGMPPSTGPTVPPLPDTTTVKVSVLQVTFRASATATAEKRYGYLLEPCTVTVKRRAHEGKAVCPALVAVDGAKVSMTMEWKP